MAEIKAFTSPETEDVGSLERRLRGHADALTSGGANATSLRNDLHLAATILAYQRGELANRLEAVKGFVASLRHFGQLNPAAESLADQLEEQLVRTWQ